jgi:hypothetical protein
VITDGAWRLDPARSSVEFLRAASKLIVRGRLVSR